MTGRRPGAGRWWCDGVEIRTVVHWGRHVPAVVRTALEVRVLAQDPAPPGDDPPPHADHPLGA